MVRGATLELLDITYDGVEDPVTGYLRGGLGQLVDGKYGAEDFRAFGENGVIRGNFLFRGVQRHVLMFLYEHFLHFQAMSGLAGKIRPWGLCRWILHSRIFDSSAQ